MDEHELPRAAMTNVAAPTQRIRPARRYLSHVRGVHAPTFGRVLPRGFDVEAFESGLAHK